MIEQMFDTLMRWLGSRGFGTASGDASLGGTSRSTMCPSRGPLFGFTYAAAAPALQEAASCRQAASGFNCLQVPWWAFLGFGRTLRGQSSRISVSSDTS